MPSAVPAANSAPMSPTARANGVNGEAAKGLSVNDNIARFEAPSRPLSPGDEHTLFHDKTRCFV